MDETRFCEYQGSIQTNMTRVCKFWEPCPHQQIVRLNQRPLCNLEQAGRNEVSDTGQRLFAFWKYDTLPYYLGGEADEVLESGKVRLKSVYKGLEVTPVKILSYEQGIKVKARLEELARKTREKMKQLDDACKRDAMGLLGIGE
jgi:hypothetical protein